MRLSGATTRVMGFTGALCLVIAGTGLLAVHRPAFGGWYVDGQTTQFIGLSTDVPVPADYDGDEDTERAVYRPQFGGWYVQDTPTVFYGLGTDTPLPLPAAVYNTYY